MAGPRRGLRGRRALVAAALVALFAVPPVYMAVATPPPGPVRLPATDDERARYRVYVGDWGYHTSIVVEQPRGWRLGPLGREDAPFVEYAWGDRRFYMESNFWPHAVFAAAFLPTASVTYVDGWPRAPTAADGARSLSVADVDGATLRALVVSLEATMRRTAGGDRLPPFPPARGYAGRFYPAREFYIFWHDCNDWTVRRLAAAGLARRTAPPALFSFQVPGRLVGFTRAQ